MKTWTLVCTLFAIVLVTACVPEEPENMDEDGTITDDSNQPFYLQSSDRDVALHSVFGAAVVPASEMQWKWLMALASSEGKYKWEAWITEGTHVPVLSDVEAYYQEFISNGVESALELADDDFHMVFDCDTHGSIDFEATKVDSASQNTVVYTFTSVYNKCVSIPTEIAVDKNYPTPITVRHGSRVVSVTYALNELDQVIQTDWSYSSEGVSDAVSQWPVQGESEAGAVHSIAMALSKTLQASHAADSDDIEIDLSLTTTFNFVAYIESMWQTITADLTLNLLNPINYQLSQGLSGSSFIYNIEGGSHVWQVTVVDGESSTTFDGQAL